MPTLDARPVQSVGASSGTRPLGLYVHIPFCQKKCPYCDFNTYAGLETLYDDYVDALCRELRTWGRLLQRPTVDTIFLGGGTPTVLAPELLSRVVETIHDAFVLAPGCEFTSEANPGTVDRDRFHHLRHLGVNRLSMGVQSFQPDELAFLGRIHSAEDAELAFAAARDAGFENINLDFMFGLPHQSSSAWQETLARALALAPEHLSLYSLIVEPGTPLHHWVQIGRIDEPDEDEAALLYKIAMETMDSAGYCQYEVSNFARGSIPQSAVDGATNSGVGMNDRGNPSDLVPALACRHNLIYWRNQEYIGAGPGAHGHLRRARARQTGLLGADLIAKSEDTADPADPTGAMASAVAVRWGNRRPVPGYVRRMNADTAETLSTIQAFVEPIDEAMARGETMMLGLRLIDEGVSLARFRRRHGLDLFDAYPQTLERFERMGLLVRAGGDAEEREERVHLTGRGLMVGNQIFAEFLP